MLNNYTTLSPSDFETLAADVVSAVHSVAFERYGEGPDGGIDCRHQTANGDVWVGQAKRYKEVSALLRAMPKEQQKMQALTTPPKRYFLVTACSLTPGNKDSILQSMRPFVHSTGDIYGADDLDALLHEYPRIYRKHFRLWLHSVEQLSQYLNQAYHARVEMVLERLLAEANNYVVPAAQPTIIDQLATHHSCLIVGDPGSGKSATAGQIALQQQIENPNAELIWIDDRNFDQALQLIRADSEHIMVLDDFLGATFLQDNGLLAFKRDWQTLLFKARQANGQLKLLFTTRDYILEQAFTQLGENHGNITQLCGRAVRMKHASAKFRAELVHRLVQTAGFTEAQLTTLVQERLYWPLIKTAHFSPRHIAMFCDKLTMVPAQQLKNTIEQGIQNQQQLWQEVFNRQSHEAQTLLYLCALAGHYANATELKRAFNTLYPAIQGRVAPLNGFDQALIELEPAFITTEHQLNEIWVSPVNPSLVDFLHHSIIDNMPLIDALIQSLEHFDWGLSSFKLTGGSNSPIPLKAKQRIALADKLLELLDEPGSKLLQSYQRGSLEWCNQPETSGAKVAKLWRSVKGDPEEAQRLIDKLRHQLPETAQWPGLYKQGSMPDLLDITRYLADDQQPQLWRHAIENLSNSEDAAALAEFYSQHRQAQKALKPHWREMRANIEQACNREIHSTDDPDHLNAILGDLYRIEDALGLSLKQQVQDIYRAIDDIYQGEDTLFDEPPVAYYQQPEVPSELAEVERQLVGIGGEVEEMFLGLGE